MYPYYDSMLHVHVCIRGTVMTKYCQNVHVLWQAEECMSFKMSLEHIARPSSPTTCGLENSDRNDRLEVW